MVPKDIGGGIFYIEGGGVNVVKIILWCGGWSLFVYISNTRQHGTPTGYLGGWHTGGFGIVIKRDNLFYYLIK